MKILVDTSIWSLALRKKTLTQTEKKYVNELKELINEFEQYFGETSNIWVEYVSEIPLLSSGKRKKVVNKICS